MSVSTGPMTPRNFRAALFPSHGPKPTCSRAGRGRRPEDARYIPVSRRFHRRPTIPQRRGRSLCAPAAGEPPHCTGRKVSGQSADERKFSNMGQLRAIVCLWTRGVGAGKWGGLDTDRRPKKDGRNAYSNSLPTFKRQPVKPLATPISIRSQLNGPMAPTGQEYLPYGQTRLPSVRGS